MPRVTAEPTAVPTPAPAPEPAPAPAPAPAPVNPGPTVEQLQAEIQKLRDLVAAGFATPAPAPVPAGPVVSVNVPPAPTFVDEYIAREYRDEVADEDGDRVRSTPSEIPGGRPTLQRYRVEEGTTLHVRRLEARVETRGDGGKWAVPVDGRDAVPFGPGRAGHFGIPEAAAK